MMEVEKCALLTKNELRLSSLPKNRIKHIEFIYFLMCHHCPRKKKLKVLSSTGSAVHFFFRKFKENQVYFQFIKNGKNSRNIHFYSSVTVSALAIGVLPDLNSLLWLFVFTRYYLGIYFNQRKKTLYIVTYMYQLDGGVYFVKHL